MAADNFDDSKADEALKFIRELRSISLDGYRVVGNCVRYDSAARGLLIKIKDEIISCLRSGNALQENYLIGGLPGSGKTFFVEELGKFISDFATFEKFKLSDLDKTTFLQKLAQLKEKRGPLLCLIDEVDKQLPDEWPFVALITPLEKTYRSFPTCFVLVGSGGSQVSELKKLIGSSKAGGDILRRVSFKREEDVLPTSLADRIIVALSNLTEEAKKTGSVVHHVDKLALLYIALNRQLASPSKIADLAERCIRKKEKSSDTVYYNDFFDRSDPELGEFQSKWNHTNLLGSVVHMEDDQAQRPRSKGVKFDQVFERVEIAFEREMRDNFLRDLDYSGQPDYIKLLHPDLRHLLKGFLKENDTILVAGHEGVGKTFNCLLFGKMLASEGRKVYYSSVHKAVGLLADGFLEVADLAYGNFVFIIDNCQEDLEKTRKILRGIRDFPFETMDQPKFIFLSHPLDEFDTVQFFGGDIRILEFKERYVDLEYLVKLFLRSLNMYNKLTEFLNWLGKSDTSKAFARYRNMKFWNIYFSAVRKFRKIVINESEFLNNARQFFNDKKPQLIELKNPLAKLLPFFANGRSVLTEYVKNELQISEDRIIELEANGIVDRISVPWEDENWDNCDAPAIRCRIHPTEAKILEALLQKCDAMKIDDTKVLIDYSAKYSESLYYIMREIRFYNSALLEDLCREERFKSIVQKYLRERHLGKHLDRTVRILSKLPQELRKQFAKDDIVDKWIEKLNDAEYRMNSKVSLLKAIYHLNPIAAYKCYEKLDINTLAENFRSIPPKPRSGAKAFARFIGISKNIWSFYLFSINPVFENGLNANRLPDGLKKDFRNEGYVLSNRAKVEQISIGRWRILDTENSFLLGRSGRALNVHYSFDDLKRQALSIDKTKKAFDECFVTLLERFEMDPFFTQIHWLLKRSDAIKDFTTGKTLANYFLEMIGPQKVVEWIKLKDTAVHELRFVFKPSRSIFIELEGKKMKMYPSFLIGSLAYEDIKRVFENPRSSLYSVCITSKFGHELLANYLYQYSLEEGFAKKVFPANLYHINESIELVERNDGLSDQQRHHIAYRIMFNTVSTKDLRWFVEKSVRVAERHGKQFDIDKETKRFLDNKEKYAAPPSQLNLGI